MATKNDITGDALISKVNTKAYEDNFDKIFGKKKDKLVYSEMQDPDSWGETRIDTIGQNGNNGEHYGKDTTT